MAKNTQRGSGMYESPQAAADGLSTSAIGGSAPTHVDIIESANARGQKRHEMKGDPYADQNVLPTSARMSGNEMVGIKDNGYLVKKGLEAGVNAMYNSLPPGMDIEDQENADIRQEPVRLYSGGLSFPDDGWKS